MPDTEAEMIRTFGIRLSVVVETIEQGSRGSSPATALPSPTKLDTNQRTKRLAEIGEYLATSQTQGPNLEQGRAPVRTVVPDAVESIGIACPDTSWVESCCHDPHRPWITSGWPTMHSRGRTPNPRTIQNPRDRCPQQRQYPNSPVPFAMLSDTPEHARRHRLRRRGPPPGRQ